MPTTLSRSTTAHGVPEHALPDAGEPPRMFLDVDGNWRGRPRLPIDRAYEPCSLSVTVYTKEELRPDRAQTNISLGAWSLALYSRPEQLREFAALLNEAADLIDMLGRLDHDADNDFDDGPHIVPDSAERLQDCMTNGIGAPQ